MMYPLPSIGARSGGLLTATDTFPGPWHSWRNINGTFVLDVSFLPCSNLQHVHLSKGLQRPLPAPTNHPLQVGKPPTSEATNETGLPGNQVQKQKNKAQRRRRFERTTVCKQRRISCRDKCYSTVK
jgi:hypothetical protein